MDLAPSGGRVLLVDDPGFFRDFVAETLRSAGLRLQVVHDEETALAALAGSDFGLLVLEVRMAGLDAEAFVTRVRKDRPPGSPAILGLSGAGLDRRELERLRAAGVDDFVSKLAPEERLVFRSRSLLHPARADGREYRRVAVSLPLRWRSGGITAWSRTLTLSEGGLFVRCDVPPDPGASVWVHFGLPDSSRELDVESVVAHVVTYADGPGSVPGFGVKFAGLSGDDRAALSAYLEREALTTV